MAPPFAGVVFTNALELRQIGGGTHAVSCLFALEGTVIWSSLEAGEFIMQDESGGIRVECDLQQQPVLHVGDHAYVSGRAIASATGLRQVFIDNDGRHAPLEATQSIYLESGRSPIHLDYFNGLAGFDLNLEYAGPNIARQVVPDNALFRLARRDNANAGELDRGLNYRLYEGNWQSLPDFSQLTAIKTGMVSNFDLSVRTHDQLFGMQFEGYLEVPCAGVFSFWLRSDDGSRLYVGGSPIVIRDTGRTAMPRARQVMPGEILSLGDEWRWSQAEGMLLAIEPQPGGGMQATVAAGTNCLRVDVAENSGAAPALFTTVRVSGPCIGTLNPNGGGRVARLRAADWGSFVTLNSPATDAHSAAPMTVGQIRTLTAAGQCDPGAVQLQGVVLAADSARGLLTVADASGVALLELDLRGWQLHRGQRVAVSGNCFVDGARLVFRPAALVNSDGLHNLAEKSAAIFLTAGRHPLHLSWFNWEAPEALELYWHGPGQPRQKIPATALVHPELASDTGAITWPAGLTYQAYEGRWLQVPSTDRLEPVKRGITPTFDTSLATRPQQTALEFGGCLEVPRDGVYTLATVSDDGCILYVDALPTHLEILGDASFPPPANIAPHQMLGADQTYVWAQSEGRVTFASQRARSLTLELNAGTGRMRVEIADGTGASPQLLLNSRIRATGICQADYTADGQRVAGTLVVASVKELEYVELAPSHWGDYPVVPMSRLAETTVREDADTVAHVRGKVVAQAGDGSLILEDTSGQVRCYTAQTPPESDALEIEAVGRLCRDGTNSVLRCGFFREAAGPSDGAPAGLPVLTTIEQVKRLTRREAQRSYPVKIRGVVTSALTAGCFVQDAAWAIYVRWPNTIKGDFPRTGEYWEIEGITFAEFAPNIRARHAVRLGTAVMPEPFRPTWDQLINGSLDIRYVEIQGVVTGVDSDGLVLLTRDGRIKVQLAELTPQTLKQYQDAIIRLRGCLVPEKDPNAHKVELGRIGLSNCSVAVDEPAPADPFALPLKRIGELLQFDPRASSIQRVKLSGQILREHQGEFFMIENDTGLRFFLRSPGDYRPGDLVEVVGFPDLGGPSPVLRETLVRRTGRAPLPNPVTVSATNLLSRRFDATRVRLEARLANISFNRSEQVLELQAGGRGFLARLDARQGRLDLAPATRLELTGVYAGQGGDLASGRDIGSFELLLGSLNDIRVLQRPSWWTGQHALMVLTVMSILIVAAVLWITQLRRQVEDRSQLLAAEVRRHEQTDRQRALEQERARISRDLHDDLGATLTQIRLLSALESRDAAVPLSSRSRMSEVTEKSRQMVASLDEIVWAVNPANDSLPSLATYLCQFAEEFLRPTPIRCRLDVPDSLPHLPLTSEVRHNLYLAVREALNNIAKHSQATEVWLRIQFHKQSVGISLEDNGRGFSFPAEAMAGDGLHNMRDRLERIGGNFECQTRTGAGTVCRISLPLSGNGHGI